MENIWKEIQPHATYQAIYTKPIDKAQQDSLVYLYQPIIGAQALSLYFTLLGDISEETGESESYLHADLSTILNIGFPQLYDARQKLEGIGLIDSYVREVDDQEGFIYVLHGPLTPQAFFGESLFNYMLIQAVGKVKYQRLVEKFTFPAREFPNYKKISRKFSDVYQINPTSFEANESLIETTQQAVMPEASPLIETQFDWHFVEKKLEQLGFTVDLSPAVKDELLVFHNLYGLDELEMVDVLSRTIQLRDGQVNLQDLQKLLENYYRGKSQGPKVKIQEESTSDLTPEEGQNFRLNSLKLAGFNDAMIQLVKESETIPPATYLQAIKTQKGGFVSKSEGWVLKELMQQANLSASVVNILLNYVLVVKNQPSLNGNYVNTIANEWAQSGITKPEEALQHILDLNKTSKNYSKTNKQTTNNQKRPVRREKLPSWMQEPVEVKHIDPQKEAEIAKKMASLNLGKEGDT